MTARGPLAVAATLAAAAALAAGCQTTPCKEGTLLLNVVVDGPATAADELRVEVMTQGQPTRSKAFPHEPGTGGGTIQIDYPDGYTPGTMSLVIVRVYNGGSAMQVAVGTATVVLANRCSTATVRLEYAGDAGMPVCNAGATCVPASGAQPCDVYKIDCSTGAPVCQRSGSKPAGMACPTGVCSQGGSCVPCQNGGDCMPADNPCKVGALACSTGAPACNAAAANRADGTPCGANKVCRAGACNDCVANQACTPPAGMCVGGSTSCATGASVCQPTTPVGAGHGCGTGMVCNGSGGCVSCQQGGACTPTVNNCRTGALNCSTGAPVCAETTTALPDGLFCANDKLCAAGACAAAGNWISRGEDFRTATGGYVYSLAFGGASIVPLTTSTTQFTPSPGGVTGKAMAVTATIPPEDPPANVFPSAGLGLNFTPMMGSLNVTARGSGIQFQARSTRAIALMVHFMDIWTDEPFKNCVDSGASNVVHRCYQHARVTCNVPAGDVWTQCRFAWTDFKRPAWGNQGDNLPLDASAVTQLQILAPATAMGGTTQTWVYAVDDVAFVP